MTDMVLAELEVWHSRPGHARPGGSRSGTWCCPSTPHRASAGCCSAPSSPTHLGGVDEELVPDIHRLDQPDRAGPAGRAAPAAPPLPGRPPRPRPQHPPADRRGRGRSASTSRTTARRCSRCSARSTRSSGSAPDARGTRSPACCTGRCAGTVRSAPRSSPTWPASRRGALAARPSPTRWRGRSTSSASRPGRSVRQEGRPGPVPHPAHGGAPRPRR